jgi:hypothetical protein
VLMVAVQIGGRPDFRNLNRAACAISGDLLLSRVP